MMPGKVIPRGLDLQKPDGEKPGGIGETLIRHACSVMLEASHISVLEYVDLEALKAHAVKE
jgi:hypothetical protein